MSLQKTITTVLSSFRTLSKPITAFAFLTVVSYSASAQGDLLITPKRVVFDGTKRSEDVSLANTGKDSASFIISFIQIRMTEEGAFEKIETPDSLQQFADPFLRIFPREVTLAPNEAQTVKIQLRRSGDMKEGEYRSHLYFRAVPKEAPLGEKRPGTDTAIAVRLRPIYGVSIPVIIKVGTSTAQLEVTDLAVQLDTAQGPIAKIAFKRSGNMSIYGDVAVNYISPQGKVTKVGAAKGFAVYTPNASRRFKLALDKSVPVNYHTGKLQVVFTDQSVATAKQAVLAEKAIDLQ